MTILSLPFWFEYLLFLFLIWVSWLELPILCWIEVVRVGILLLFQNLMGKLSAFHCWVLYWLWVCHKWLLLLRYVPSIPTLARVFTMNGCSILSNAFSASIEMVIWFLSFVDMVYHIDWFVYVEPSLWPWNESSLIMVYGPFYVLLNSVC